MDAPQPIFAGVEGVWNADPVTVATLLFRQVFAPLAAESFPARRSDLLPDDLGALCGVRLGMFRTPGGEPGATLTRLTLEYVLLWERAGIAARMIWGADVTIPQVVMLRMGLSVLQSPDPEASVRALLAR
ncbi:hypothetical protein FLP10_06070 [Agromyces intestinalis]|uniref:Uncharacterized protein n=1 Tax=Agromyces intestinalis TaxID=2592652 RepID=A0A5C1YED6_9MICO|nr:hypothetical protein [Agromyces intestinalis]QEO14038.1 hypothetical protein FLP10_06070 [Agromyces intestinalis]